MEDRIEDRTEDSAEIPIILSSGAGRLEVTMGQVERVIRAPQVIPVPRAPAGVAGMMEYEGKLIPVFFLSEDSQGVADRAVCSAVLKNQDGSFYGILAEEII